MKNRFTIRVITGDRQRVYRMTGAEDITTTEKITEMVRSILQDGGFFLDNADTEDGSTGEILEVLEKTRYMKIDYLFLHGQNIDAIEVQHEVIAEKHDAVSNT